MRVMRVSLEFEDGTYHTLDANAEGHLHWENVEKAKIVALDMYTFEWEEQDG